MPEISEIRPTILALLVGMARLVAMLALLPMYGRQVTGGLIRIGIALAFVMPTVPMLKEYTSSASIGTTEIAGLLAREVVIGLLMGWCAALPFWATEAAGFVISNQSGATMGNATDALSGNESSPLGTLLHITYVVVFLKSGGMEKLLDVFYLSYKVWPLSNRLLVISPQTPDHFLQLFDSMVHLAISLAAPAMIAMLLAELGLAIVSLFAPQLQVFFLAMPVKAAIALLMLLLGFSTLMDQLLIAGSGLAATVAALGGLLR